MRRNSGFTMIELMVIIAIVGILIAIAVPALTESMARRRLEGTANELSADFQYTKSQAASINAAASIVTSAHGYTVSSASATFKTIALDSKITLTSPLTVSFDPYRDFSSAPIDTPIVITLSHTQTSAQLQLKVDAVGRIQMCSPNGSFGGYVPC
ncbi:type II secretion system protein H [Polaromonas sp. OV174]|uniref:prepilin-type N-terminal cleavage/methylation domain-containing protein n=1 Tax=Polaromonas sp. OV174 TaxID=1855300 RepID=UPI0008E7D292|nr:prepilin-type N-terminal cleavage/methylation domain-containing protein [Polaromonas sp. OV174]SFC10894.1 type II secretion system protein H [Polaromonas sp. OV174]